MSNDLDALLVLLDRFEIHGYTLRDPDDQLNPGEWAVLLDDDDKIDSYLGFAAIFQFDEVGQFLKVVIGE